MILVDYSSVVFRMMHMSISLLKPKKLNGKYITKEFINLTKYQILYELLNNHNKFKGNFGEQIICLDAKDGYWRQDVYPMYKQQRKVAREESEIDFVEFFKYIEELNYQIKENLPWKTILVPKTEADDIILHISRQVEENTLIISPDKDMIQAQHNNNLISQYSPLTKKWILPETKSESMKDWLLEHIILGDVSDNVPKIVDDVYFSDIFNNFLKNKINKTFSCLGEFEKEYSPLDFIEFKEEFLKLFTNEDVFKKIRFGPTTLNKKINEHGNIKEWLKTSTKLQENFKRNYTLVTEEGIPQSIKNEILLEYKNAKTDFNFEEFNNYLKKYEIDKLSYDYKNSLINEKLSIFNIDW